MVEEALAKATRALEEQRAEGRVKFRKKAKLQATDTAPVTKPKAAGDTKSLGEKLRAQQVLAYSDEEDA